MHVGTKRGSALFLCIVSSAVLAVCGIFAQAARYRMIEAEVFRALAAQINAILIRDGGGMSSRYGLTCFEAGQDDLAVFKRLTGKLSGVGFTRASPRASIGDPVVLTEAIDGFMQYRLPAILTAQIVQRVQLIAQEIRTTSSSLPDVGPKGTAAASVGKTLSDWLLSFDFSDYLGEKPEIVAEDTPESSLPEENAEDSSGEGSMADAIREQIRTFLLDRILGEDLLRELQRIQTCLMRFQTDEAGAESSGFRFPDLLNPEAVSSFLSDMDDWLQLDADPLYQKLGHVEYVMGMCSRSMPDPGRNRPGYADGIGSRDFVSLSSAEGPDVERILSGRIDGGEAERWAFSAILAIRFAACAIGIFTNPTRFGQAKAAAAAISGVVALISAGSVVIPEGPLSIVVASVWGLAEAYDEAGRLRQGESVALYPGFDPITLRYDDYLRLLLYFVPEETLILRLGQVLLRNVPGEFYRAISISTIYRERTFALSGRYPA